MPHHYTSIETLELILRYQTIRFTRLDRFDDVTEGRVIGRFPAGSRMYASCWSDEEDESIPQWSMYGDSSRGIRLTLPVSPFPWQRIDIRWHENFQVIDIEAPYSIETMLSSGITLQPTPRMRETFGQAVCYVDDVESSIRGLSQVNEDGHVTLWGEGSEMAYFKPTRWNFQNEFRYVLQAMGGPREPFSGDAHQYLENRRAWMQSGVNFVTNVPVPLHVDLPLAPHMLDQALILVGPLADETAFARVEALVEELAPGAGVERSSLTGTIRPKN